MEQAKLSEGESFIFLRASRTGWTHANIAARGKKRSKTGDASEQRPIGKLRANVSETIAESGGISTKS